MSALPLAMALHLAASCAPSAAPETLLAVVRTDSGFNTTALHDNSSCRGAGYRFLDAFGPDRLVWGIDPLHTCFDRLESTDAAWRALAARVPDPDDHRIVPADTSRCLFRFAAELCLA